MNLKINCDTVSIKPNFPGSTLALDIRGADEFEVISEFALDQIVQEVGSHKILDFIGRQECLEFFGIREEITKPNSVK